MAISLTHSHATPFSSSFPNQDLLIPVELVFHVTQKRKSLYGEMVCIIALIASSQQDVSFKESYLGPSSSHA